MKSGNRINLRALIVFVLCLSIPVSLVLAGTGEDAEPATDESAEPGKKERPFVIAPTVISNPAFGNGLTALYDGGLGNIGSDNLYYSGGVGN